MLFKNNLHNTIWYVNEMSNNKPENVKKHEKAQRIKTRTYLPSDLEIKYIVCFLKWA